MSLARQIFGLVWSDPQDLDEHARYWATKTIAEPVVAGWELSDRAYNCAENTGDGNQIQFLKSSALHKAGADYVVVGAPSSTMYVS